METIRKLPELISVLITAARKIPLRNVLTIFGLWLLVFALRKIKIRRRRPAIASEDGEETLSPEEEKGQAGEDLIADILYETVPGEFEVLRNLYVPYRNTTVEIDLVMIHETGIFVFESKNYGGWIYGGPDDLYWLQMFPNRRKRSFYNPLRQNRNHIKALAQYLNIPGRFFYSYVVFSDECELREVPDDTRFTVITQTADLERRLAHSVFYLSKIYRPEEIQLISERLFPLTDADFSVKEKHIEDIRAALESDICPFCGAKLVIQRGKYAGFMRCSNYPQCEFTRNLV